MITTDKNGHMHDQDENLRQELAEYDNILNRIKEFDVIFQQDFEGNYLDISDYALNLIGYKREDIPHIKVNTLVAPDSLPAVLSGLDLLKNNPDQFLKLELKVRHKTGIDLYIDARARVITNRHGQQVILGVAGDITHRKKIEGELKKSIIRYQQTEQALRESEERFRKIADYSAAAIGIHKGGHYIYVNQAAERMSGFSKEELYQMNFWDLMHPSSQELVKKRGIARSRGEAVPDHYEIRINTKDGGARWVDLRTCSLELEGEPAVMGILYDVTGRKEMEEHLRVSEEKYRMVVDNATEAIAVVQEDRMMFANPATCRISGFTQDELRSRPFIEFIHQDDREMLIDRYIRRMAGEDMPRHYSFRFIDKFGQTIWLDISMTIITWEGKPAILCFLSDITLARNSEQERKSLEELLRQSQKMEAIGTLAGGIAHDFNNLLSAIIGYTELARMQMRDVAGQTSLDKVLKASERAKELVMQILSFSRQRAQELKPIKISTVVQDAFKLLRASLPSTIEIILHMQNENSIVEADPTQIHQVLMNLCTNAAYAMRDHGGALEVSLTEETLDSTKSPIHPDLHEGPYLKLAVRDTGGGIAPKIINRIFDPYFTTKAEGEGTGLGLAVIHGIVKSHGGAITVQSQPGKGACFQVYLPLLGSMEDDLEFMTSQPLPTGKEAILFVDDEVDLTDIARELLSPLGYKVVTRTSSIEALELFKNTPQQFDIVISDMTMPNMTGDVLTRNLLKIRPDIPIILCTGYSREITREKALALGAKDFLMKPLEISSLAQVIRRVLDEAQSPRSARM